MSKRATLAVQVLLKTATVERINTKFANFRLQHPFRLVFSLNTLQPISLLWTVIRCALSPSLAQHSSRLPGLCRHKGSDDSSVDAQHRKPPR